MAYKLKIGPAQGLKLKGQAGFALPLLGGIGIKATKSGGIWTVDLDYTVLTPGPISDPTTAYVAIEDKTLGIYREVSLASLLTSGLDADLQAIAALTTNGILVRTADNTWALRTLTGTANEITVTNGDGVSGNPTLSLPSALTFTGKTITGGTYTGVVSINGNIWTAGTGTLTLGAGKTATISNTLTFTGTDGSTAAFGAGGTVAYQGGTLAQFAATTSAQLRGVLSDETGTGAAYFQNGDLGTPSAAVLTNAIGLPISTGVSGLGTGVAAALSVNVGSVGAPVVNGGALGTPSSGTLTNATGLPVSSGISGLGTGVATFLATPSSANLRAALTDEVGTGAAYFVGGALGTPASGTATNLTGLPPSGLTTQGAYTLLGNNSGSSASPAAIDITALTSKASPASTDVILIQDSAASNAFKKTTVGALASAGSVASYNGRTGAVTATTTDVPLPNYLTGLTLSTAGSSATFGVATGFATDSTNASMMALGSAYTKTTSAWAVGSANGALDTGTIANSTWYHVFLIKRTDTGVVDVLISTSATSPTLPTNYTLFRRIGSMKTDGSAQWTKFSQNGDEFLWDAPVSNISTSPGSTAIQTATLSTPLGIKTVAILQVGASATGGDSRGWIFSPDMNSGGALAASTVAAINFGASSTQTWGGASRIRTNTSSQVKYAMFVATAVPFVTTVGWVDDRGKLQ